MTRPRLRADGPIVPGVVAVALFCVMALVVLATPFGDPAGFPDGVSVTAEIGYALLDLEVLQSGEGAIGETESFLAGFILLAIVLDAALDAALVLARSEEDDEPVTPVAGRSSGGGEGE